MGSSGYMITWGFMNGLKVSNRDKSSFSKLYTYYNFASEPRDWYDDSFIGAYHCFLSAP